MSYHIRLSCTSAGMANAKQGMCPGFPFVDFSCFSATYSFPHYMATGGVLLVASTKVLKSIESTTLAFSVS